MSNTSSKEPKSRLEEEKNEFKKLIKKSLIKTDKKIYEIIAGSAKTTLDFGAFKIPCYMIRTEDGDIPVLSGRGMQKALGLPNKTGTELQNLFNSKELSGLITDDLLQAINTVYAFKRDGAGGSQAMTFGSRARVFIKICIFFRNALDKGYLPERNAYIAHKASQIIDNFAEEGIEAVAKRITGYDDIKERYAIEKALGTVVAPEIREYAKRFDKWFYEEIYRLKGWDYEPIRNGTIKNTNSQLGLITMDIVWDRVIAGLQNKLKELNNERDKSGNLTHYHHQHLTDKGLALLKSHLSFLEALLKTSKTWESFMFNLDILKPKLGDIKDALGFEEKLRLV